MPESGCLRGELNSCRLWQCRRLLPEKTQNSSNTVPGVRKKQLPFNDDGTDEKLDGTDDYGEMIGLGLLRYEVLSRFCEVRRMEKRNDSLTHEIIAAAIAVSKYWGNGVLENVYKKSIAHELKRRGLDVATEVPISASHVYATVSYSDGASNKLPLSSIHKGHYTSIALELFPLSYPPSSVPSSLNSRSAVLPFRHYTISIASP